ncbi:uncharacterized protein LOC111710462 isoform X2 [Eurytemora carolleeae]|uniref:uncharacterized protein LOC111710462 isoform X2 n=1 Tax=Eurytemora carolleeae TaxID=1294199 RepID=UPI000C772862|nr:uncharacterized protein LOC111710462 isoform X2 [Eurytemora carolleeae]|eukprot:XP_023340328.1 uncharacterized protein LOC111710462 isoform X2 [Eurytemora affinis]
MDLEYVKFTYWEDQEIKAAVKVAVEEMGIENLEYIHGSSGSEEDEVESENLMDDDIIEEMEDENIDETGEMSEKEEILRSLELRFSDETLNEIDETKFKDLVLLFRGLIEISSSQGLNEFLEQRLRDDSIVEYVLTFINRLAVSSEALIQIEYNPMVFISRENHRPPPQNNLLILER